MKKKTYHGAIIFGYNSFFNSKPTSKELFVLIKDNLIFMVFTESLTSNVILIGKVHSFKY